MQKKWNEGSTQEVIGSLNLKAEELIRTWMDFMEVKLQ